MQIKNFPKKKFKLIYADPPWSFKNYSIKGEPRNPKAHYDVMNLDDIKNLPVNTIADDDCILLLWAIDPLLDKALEVIDSWGFKFKTVGFYWAKLNTTANIKNMDEKSFFTGLGYWTRANPEQCLLATKGKPKRNSKAVKRFIVSHRREHSRKPDEIYQRIETLADGPYLELFSRSKRKGWKSWGNEKETFSKGSVNTRKRPSKWIEEKNIDLFNYKKK